MHIGKYTVLSMSLPCIRLMKNDPRARLRDFVLCYADIQLNVHAVTVLFQLALY